MSALVVFLPFLCHETIDHGFGPSGLSGIATVDFDQASQLSTGPFELEVTEFDAGTMTVTRTPAPLPTKSLTRPRMGLT
jgi:hypothetical protein